ncbi:hypothetical protein [uncultured Bdellovibrio sp.]|uniref:hypothetical protein n=1 Tax=Bdellovibrio sp. HCB-162 TaxID=3394234 RepID=UPI0025E75D4A|nr:hypothetical protein [uncultured Bdellovibrio sp.]
MRMSKPQALKILGTVSGTVLLLLAFQNCGQQLGEGFQIDTKSVQLNSQGNSLGNVDTGTKTPTGDGDEDLGEASTGDLCEDQLLAKFGSGYHVFLKQNCAGCHDGNHEAPAFASKNVLASYQVFKDKGYLAISNNAVSEKHNPPATGAHNNGAISSLKQEWESAQAAWLQCKGSDAQDKSIVTINKTDANIIASKANSATWTTLTWNLNTEVAANMPKFPLQMTVEAQVAKVSGNEVGYAVRNPTMSITSGTAKYRVKALFFYVNSKLLDSATVYRNINAVVCPGTPLNLAPVGNAQLLVMSPIKNTDKFALQFTSIEKAESTAKCGTGSTDTAPIDNTPATVSFAQLTATTGTLNVFRTQCFSCHTGAGANGGLDLSNYTASKNAASKILTRINDAGSPMPRSGLMSSQMRAIVEKWVTTGTPQN